MAGRSPRGRPAVGPCARGLRLALAPRRRLERDLARGVACAGGRLAHRVDLQRLARDRLRGLLAHLDLEGPLGACGHLEALRAERLDLALDRALKAQGADAGP